MWKELLLLQLLHWPTPEEPQLERLWQLGLLPHLLMMAWCLRRPRKAHISVPMKILSHLLLTIVLNRR